MKTATDQGTLNKIMTLFTYFETVPGMYVEHEFQMLKLWERWHWELGLETFCLREYHARKHPHYADYEAAVKAMPTINPKAYEAACYMRWLAMVQHCGPEGGVMSDYDCFLIVPKAAIPAVTPKLTVCQNVVPSLVAGSGAQYEWACKMFIKLASELPAGSKHTSDMMMLEQIALKGDADSFARVKTVFQYGEVGWEYAPAIHFAHSSFPGGTHRAQLIPQLLEKAIYAKRPQPIESGESGAPSEPESAPAKPIQQGDKAGDVGANAPSPS